MGGECHDEGCDAVGIGCRGLDVPVMGGGRNIHLFYSIIAGWAWVEHNVEAFEVILGPDTYVTEHGFATMLGLESTLERLCPEVSPAFVVGCIESTGVVSS